MNKPLSAKAIAAMQLDDAIKWDRAENAGLRVIPLKGEAAVSVGGKFLEQMKTGFSSWSPTYKNN